MSSPATAIAVDDTLKALEKQRDLISACTQLWNDLSAHFQTLDSQIQTKSESLRTKRKSLDAATRNSLDSLRRRELTIDSSVSQAISKIHEISARASKSVSENDQNADLSEKIKILCAKMDFEGFLTLLAGKRKDIEILKAELPLALGECIDPGNFALDVVSRIFPVDSGEAGWVCVVVLEALVPVLEDPEIGKERMMVTRSVRERARGMAEKWKGRVEKIGGIENVKPMDGHAFLQLVVTFGIVEKEDREFYRRIVVSFAWRRQMPKLAVALGLLDLMEDIVEELIHKGHQLDAINFVFEAGLQEKFPPIPLVKSFLKESKKAMTISTVEDTNNPDQAVCNNNRKEQAAIRSAMKCIQDHNLEADFPLENLQKRLEQLEKVKQDKKRPSVSGPAPKRTRASNGGPMPPAKAGRLTNNAYVSSFPAAPAFVQSPSHTEYSAASPYAYDRPVYGSRSPSALREPYPYPSAEGSPAAIGSPYHSPMSYPATPPMYPATPPMNYPPTPPMSYPPTPPMNYPATPPMSYPAYGSYNNALGGYNNGMAPGYQQAYYR